MKTSTRTKSPADYLREPYARILIPEEDGRFSAEVLEFPGCFSQGSTADEAMANLEEAARSWIEATLERGRPIPEPSANYEASGKVALRLPRSLHRRAVRLAEREGVSLNTFLIGAVTARVEAKELTSHVIGHVEQLMKEMEQRLRRQTTQDSLRIAASIVKVPGWGGSDVTLPKSGGVVEWHDYARPRRLDADLVSVDEAEAPFSALINQRLI
jgi:predicted RNase H-like HicB family nuclease